MMSQKNENAVGAMKLPTITCRMVRPREMRAEEHADEGRHEIHQPQ